MRLLSLIVPAILSLNLSAAPQEEAYLTATKEYTLAYIDYLGKTSELESLKKEHAQQLAQIGGLEKERADLKKAIKDLENQLKNIDAVIRDAAMKIRSTAIELMSDVKNGNDVLSDAGKGAFPEIHAELDQLTTAIRTNQLKTSEEIRQRLNPTLHKVNANLLAGLTSLKQEMDQKASALQSQIAPLQAELDRIAATSRFRELQDQINRHYGSYTTNKTWADEMAAEADRLARELSSLESEISSLTYKRDTDLPYQIRNAESDRERARRDVDDYERKVTDLRQRMRETQRRKQEASRRNPPDTAEVSRLESEISRLQSEIQNTEYYKSDAEQKVRNAEDKIRDLQSEQTRVAHRIGDLQYQATNKRNDVNRTRDKADGYRRAADSAYAQYQQYERQLNEYKAQTGYTEKYQQLSQLKRQKSTAEAVSRASSDSQQEIAGKRDGVSARLADMAGKEQSRGTIPVAIAEKTKRMNEGIDADLKTVKDKAQSLKTDYTAKTSALAPLSKRIGEAENALGPVRADLYKYFKDNNIPAPETLRLETQTLQWKYQLLNPHPAWQAPACVAFGNDVKKDGRQPTDQTVVRMEILGLKGLEGNASAFSEATILLEALEGVPKSFEVEMKMDNGRVYKFSEVSIVDGNTPSEVKQVFAPKLSERERLIQDMKQRTWANIKFKFSDKVVFEIPRFGFNGVTNALSHMDNDEGGGAEICKVKYTQLGKPDVLR